MSDKNDQITSFPKGDILYHHKPDDLPTKFEYLKGKYIFRFPFTITAIKWGVAMGSFFALHTYFKTRSFINSIYWFTCGSILTGMPIWGFYMIKYSFYSLTLRKFEKEQHEQVEDYNLLKEYMIKKVNAQDKNISDQDLMNLINIRHKEKFLQNSELDDLLSDDAMQEIEELIKK